MRRSIVRAERGAAALATLRTAEQETRTALGANSDLPWAHLNLGAILMERSRLGDAPGTDRPDGAAGTSLLDEAIDHFQCDALIQRRDHGRALEACLEAMQGAMHPDPYYNLGGVYALLGRPDDALAALIARMKKE